MSKFVDDDDYHEETPQTYFDFIEDLEEFIEIQYDQIKGNGELKQSYVNKQQQQRLQLTEEQYKLLLHLWLAEQQKKNINNSNKKGT